jgi:hypothetical protein
MIYLIVIAVLFVVGYIWHYISVEQERLRQEQERLRQLELARQQHISRIKEMVVAHCLVIDSNIWMKPEYNVFFEILNRVLRENRIKLTLFAPQFDEI